MGSGPLAGPIPGPPVKSARVVGDVLAVSIPTVTRNAYADALARMGVQDFSQRYPGLIDGQGTFGSRVTATVPPPCVTPRRARASPSLLLDEIDEGIGRVCVQPPRRFHRRAGSSCRHACRSRSTALAALSRRLAVEIPEPANLRKRSACVAPHQEPACRDELFTPMLA